MRNLKVMMAYRGTNYHGFQRQENALTVQEVVEEKVSSVLNEKVIINGCSRTDTGVHANNYCFSVLTESRIPPLNFVRESMADFLTIFQSFHVKKFRRIFTQDFRAKQKNTFIRYITAKVRIRLKQTFLTITDARLMQSLSEKQLKNLSELMISVHFLPIAVIKKPQ